jgi:hypothetical protein
MGVYTPEIETVGPSLIDAGDVAVVVVLRVLVRLWGWGYG